jgi:hypothetical protein
MMRVLAILDFFELRDQQGVFSTKHVDLIEQFLDGPA